MRCRARVHVSRNPRIARVLTELGVMREQGEGIPRMFAEMEESYLPLPEFEADDHSFAVTLRNRPIFDVGDPEWIQHLRSLPVNNRQRRILAARKGAGFTNGEYGRLWFSVPLTSVKSDSCACAIRYQRGNPKRHQPGWVPGRTGPGG